MTNGQTNYSNMTDVTIAIVDENAGLWTGNPKFSKRVDDVKLSVADIDIIAGVQRKKSTGATTTKEELWAIAAIKTEHIIDGLKPYFSDKDDKINLEAVSYSISSYNKGNSDNSLKIMQLIYGIGEPLVAAELVPFGIEVGEIADQLIAINKFGKAKPTKKVMTSTSKTATKELRSAYKLLRYRVGQLDLMVNTKKSTAPTFVEKYDFGRKIIHAGKGHVTEEVVLMPDHMEALLGKKFKAGDIITIRNHSDFPVTVGLTDTPELFPDSNLVIEGYKEARLKVPEDFNCIFGHWLMVNNPSHFDDVSITILLAKG